VTGEEDGDEIGGGHARRRVAAARGGAAPDRIDPKLLSEFTDGVEVVGFD
jgi:hypothetical protein